MKRNCVVQYEVNDYQRRQNCCIPYTPFGPRLSHSRFFNGGMNSWSSSCDLFSVQATSVPSSFVTLYELTKSVVTLSFHSSLLCSSYRTTYLGTTSLNDCTHRQAWIAGNLRDGVGRKALTYDGYSSSDENSDDSRTGMNNTLKREGEVLPQVPPQCSLHC